MRKKKLSLDRDACFSEIPRAAVSQVATRHSLPLSNGSKREKRGQSTARLLTEQNVTRSPFSWPYRQTDQGVKAIQCNQRAFRGPSERREAWELRSGYALTPSPRSESRRKTETLFKPQERRAKTDSTNDQLQWAIIVVAPVKNSCR